MDLWTVAINSLKHCWYGVKPPNSCFFTNANFLDLSKFEAFEE